VPQLAPVEQDVKSTQYTFELISGNVKEVIYQQADRDQMTHRYTYDRLNRLTQVHTSTDGGVHESREAHYRYFDYGPMARVEIGEHKVQANDYAYTINGWLKGMNSNTLDPTRDMGLDGSTGYLASDTHVHELFARDVTGFTMGYYLGDYSGIGALGFEAELGIGNHLTDALKELYNGNIAHTVTAIDGFDVQAGVYTYDQLQRLKEMRVFRGADVVSDNEWVSATETSEYHSNYAYDANGNLVRLNRNGNSTTGLDMDEFAYNLTTVAGQLSNRLDYVADGGTDYAGYDDIKTGQSSGNYSYDQIGELVADNQEHISRISWRRGDKKVLKIEHDDATSPQLEFVYNPFGQRVLKIEKPRVDGDIVGEGDWKYTYYAYDANGQVMGTYNIVLSESDNTADLDELNIYGQSRIGVIQNGRTLYNNGHPLDYTGYGDDGIFINILGQKKYELTNHLGNVNAVITDRKIVSSGGSLSIYEAVVIMKSDYYPFGMAMPGRTYQTDQYRYAYNGMEQDPEVKGQGNSYTTEFRQYDPRLGRWLSLDPMMHEFPWMSPYMAFDNNPIYYNDPLGLEGEPQTKDWKVGETCMDENQNNLKYLGRGKWEGVHDAENRRALKDYDWLTQAWNFANGNRHLNFAKEYAAKNNTLPISVFGGDIAVVITKDTKNSRVFVRKGLGDDDGVNINEVSIRTPEEYLYDRIMEIINSNNIGFALFGESDEEVSVDGQTFIISVNYVIDIKPAESGFLKFRIRFRTGLKNGVYARFRNGLPYIGKSFDMAKRYSSLVRFNSGMRTIVSGINDTKLLRAVEQRMQDYLKIERGVALDNKIRAMNLNDYLKYSDQVDELLKGVDWKGALDEIFKLSKQQ
jgi:RHS repeat-associated protein